VSKCLHHSKSFRAIIEFLTEATKIENSNITYIACKCAIYLNARAQFTWMQERVNDYLLWRCQHTHIQMTWKKDISLDLCLSHVSFVLTFPMGLTFITTPQVCSINKLVRPPHYYCCLLLIQITRKILHPSWA